MTVIRVLSLPVGSYLLMAVLLTANCKSTNTAKDGAELTAVTSIGPSAPFAKCSGTSSNGGGKYDVDITISTQKHVQPNSYLAGTWVVKRNNQIINTKLILFEVELVAPHWSETGPAYEGKRIHIREYSISPPLDYLHKFGGQILREFAVLTVAPTQHDGEGGGRVAVGKATTSFTFAYWSDAERTMKEVPMTCSGDSGKMWELVKDLDVRRLPSKFGDND